MQERWRSFECDRGAQGPESAQRKRNSELLERQQELQAQLETCNRDLEKHQAKQETWNSTIEQHQQELESKQEQDKTELKDRQLDNQFSVEECIKKLTNQQAELENINVMFTTIKECSQKLNELNANTKGNTLRQDPVVETSRGSYKLQLQCSPLPPSPTPPKNLESKKRDFITPPVSVSNGSSRPTNAPKRSNEEYREEARANSHLQRFGTPGVSSLTSRRQTTPSTPMVSASANMYPSLKKRQPSREIAPPAKRVMASTESTSPARSRTGDSKYSSMTANQPKPSPRNTPVVKTGTDMTMSKAKAKATDSTPINQIPKATSGSYIKSNVPGRSLEVVITPPKHEYEPYRASQEALPSRG